MDVHSGTMLIDLNKSSNEFDGKDPHRVHEGNPHGLVIGNFLHQIVEENRGSHLQKHIEQVHKPAN